MRLVRQHQRKRQGGPDHRWFFLLGGIVFFVVGTWVVLQILDRPSHSESSPQPVPKAAPAPASTAPAPSSPDDNFTFYKTLQAPPHAKSEPPGLEPKSPVVLRGRTSEPFPDPVTHPQKTRSKGFDIKVAAFREKPAAMNLMHRLKTKKYPVHLLTVGTGGQETWYRVRVGPYATRVQAEDAARRLKAKERLGSYIARSTEAR
jgi:cell division septation protein DedD